MIPMFRVCASAYLRGIKLCACFLSDNEKVGVFPSTETRGMPPAWSSGLLWRGLNRAACRLVLKPMREVVGLVDVPSSTDYAVNLVGADDSIFLVIDLQAAIELREVLANSGRWGVIIPEIHVSVENDNPGRLVSKPC